MTDPRKMSVEEMLAAARAEKSKSGGKPASEKPREEESATPAKAESAGRSVSSADARKMSVEEMLAAARGEKAAGGAAKEKAAPAEEPVAESSGEKLDPAAARKMSVADMLAAARSEKSKPADKPAAKKKPAAAAKKAPAGEKAASAEPEKTGPLDTASILAAARTDKTKRGPMSKSEAASQGVAVKEKAKRSAPPMPERPAYAQPRPARAAAGEDQTRRGFFAMAMGALFGSSLAIGFTTLAFTQVLWVLGLARYMFPNILTEPPTRFKVGSPGELAPGQVETKYKAQFGVWIVRNVYEGQDVIVALKSVCTHLGCTPNWLEGEQKFKCPCHGSGFYKDGINFEGPAPRPLERYAIAVADDGQLEVDKSQTFNEEKGQWKNGASFVSV